MKKKNYILIASIIIILICAAAYAYELLFAEYNYENVRVEIPRGTGDDDVKKIMTDALGKDFGSKVAVLWSLQGGNAAASHGSYLIENGTTALKASRNIVKGRQTPVRFTFNNMRFLEDVAARASQIMEFDSVAFMLAAESTLKARGYKYPEYQAAILPDTYEFYWTASPAHVIEVLANHRDKFWDEEKTAKARKMGLTPNEVHTLASIIEEETARLDERPTVARLYLNRIARHMPLQADPTLKFAVKDFAIKRVTGKLFSLDSPYNTYKHTGLPPGPIRIVEPLSLEAVLDAPQHDYLYMCAKSDFSGYHDFASDYNRHRINAARYHRTLDARGIR